MGRGECGSVKKFTGCCQHTFERGEEREGGRRGGRLQFVGRYISHRDQGSSEA